MKGPIFKEITTDGSSMTIKRDIISGYDLTICVKCKTTSGSEKYFNNWQIKQNQLDCSTALVVKSNLPLPNPLVIPFENGGPDLPYISNYDDVFDH